MINDALQFERTVYHSSPGLYIVVRVDYAL